MKRILLYNFLFAFVLFSLFSCGNGSKFRNQLCALDSALVAHPDSVYEVLQGMKEEAVTHSKSDRMYFELLQADAQNKAYIDFTTDSVMLKVADYYDKHGTPNEQMRAHYLLGCTYRDLGDAPSALDCLQDACTYANTSHSNTDYHLLMIVHSQMASLYKSQRLTSYAIQETNEASRFAKISADSLSFLNLTLQNAQLQILNNDFDQSKLYIQKALELSKTLRVWEYEKMALCLYAQVEIAQNNWDAAKSYLDKTAESTTLREHPRHINGGTGSILSLYATIYKNTAKLDSAIIYYNKVINLRNKETDIIANSYKSLAELYEKTGKQDSVIICTRLYREYLDNSIEQLSNTELQKLTSVYNYSRQKNIAKAKELEAETNLRTLYLYIAFSFFVFIIILFVTIQLKQKKDKKISEMTNMYFEVISQKEAVLRDIDVLKAELVSKNSQQKDLKNALITKEKELISLQSQVDYYSKSLHLNKLEERVRAFTETSIFKKLKYSINFKNAEMKLTSSDWERFFHLYQQYFPTYYNNITTNTQINHDEKEVCLLLIFNFTTKELSAILCKSMPRISNIRASINKKLFNIDSATTLDVNIRKLFR